MIAPVAQASEQESQTTPALAAPVDPVQPPASAPAPTIAAGATTNAPLAPLPAPPATTALHHEDPESITVSTRLPGARIDPFKGLNVVTFKTVQVVDDALISPLAKGYRAIMPTPIRDGLHNVIYNLREPFIAANFLLQLKPGKSAETLGRFALNSTVGLAGLFDVARRKPFRLPHRSNSFSNTLGYYGVGTGPYMYLPLIGPTTLRDLTGRVADRMVLPFALGGTSIPVEVTVPVVVVGVMDRRLVDDERVALLRNGKPDPYTATREDYLKRRKAEITALKANKPVDESTSTE